MDFLNIIPSYQRNFHFYDVRYNRSAQDSKDSTFSEENRSFQWSIGHQNVEINMEIFRLFRNNQGVATKRLSFIPRLIFDQVEDVDQREALNTRPNSHGFQNTPSDYRVGSN